LGRLPQLRIGVLGDLFLDRYLDIDAALTEPSLETGQNAYQVVSVRSYPGAAGTVVNNLAALGVGEIVPIGAIGQDGEGWELRHALEQLPAVKLTAVLRPLSTIFRTPTYTKPMLHEPGNLPRELNRLDIKNRAPLPEMDALILPALRAAWPSLDALIVVDQVSGCICQPGGVAYHPADWRHRGRNARSGAAALVGSLHLFAAGVVFQLLLQFIALELRHVEIEHQVFKVEVQPIGRLLRHLK
jgi:bifunctional ADP-heptose synthase (sugar kinase/adenylyltransferase)